MTAFLCALFCYQPILYHTSEKKYTPARVIYQLFSFGAEPPPRLCRETVKRGKLFGILIKMNKKTYVRGDIFLDSIRWL